MLKKNLIETSIKVLCHFKLLLLNPPLLGLEDGSPYSQHTFQILKKAKQISVSQKLWLTLRWLLKGLIQRPSPPFFFFFFFYGLTQNSLRLEKQLHGGDSSKKYLNAKEPATTTWGISGCKKRYTEKPGKKSLGNEMPWGIKVLENFHTLLEVQKTMCLYGQSACLKRPENAISSHLWLILEPWASEI